MNVRAYKKLALPGLVPQYSYTSQFPFRGHDPWCIEDAPSGKQEALADIKSFDVENDQFKAKADRVDGEADYNSPSKQVDFAR